MRLIPDAKAFLSKLSGIRADSSPNLEVPFCNILGLQTKELYGYLDTALWFPSDSTHSTIRHASRKQYSHIGWY